jgi:hypothetical protein
MSPVSLGTDPDNHRDPTIETHTLALWSNVSNLSGERSGSVEKHTTIAVALSKTVLEIAVSEQPGRVCERKRLRRGQLEAFFARRPPATVLTGACGSAHYLARQIQRLGHRVLLPPPHQTRRYVLRHKTDGADTPF